MKFTAYGHKNILAAHKNTIEFTKEKELTKNGDCIVGVDADFDLKEIKKILDFKSIKITIIVGNLKEEIIAKPNKKFNSNNEIVIRLGEFASERTLAINADKSAKYLKRELVKKLKNPEQKIVVIVTPLTGL